jgi:hypothetical protein
MKPGCIITTIIFITLCVIEHRYSPRIDITKKGDVLLWFTSIKDNHRHFKFLFKIRK